MPEKTLNYKIGPSSFYEKPISTPINDIVSKFDEREREEYEENGFFAVRLAENEGVTSDPNFAVIHLPGGGPVTPMEILPSQTLVVDMRRCEVGMVRLDPSMDIGKQMDPLEQQGWTVFERWENVGVDGLFPAFMVRKLTPKVVEG